MTQTKAQKVAYQKAYAAKNAAKVKAKKRLWYLLHVEERREAERARYHADPDKARERSQNYRASHRAECKAARRRRLMRHRAAGAEKLKNALAEVLRPK